MNINILIFILLIILQYLLDNNKNKNLYILLLIIIHHIINIYVIYGSILFGYYKIHVIIVLIGFLIHLFYRRCPITIYTNKLSNNNEKKKFETFLNHIINFFNLNIDIKLVYYTLLIIIIIYDLYNILI